MQYIKQRAPSNYVLVVKVRQDVEGWGVRLWQGGRVVTHLALASPVSAKNFTLWFLVAITIAQYLKLNNNRTPLRVIRQTG